MDVRLNYLYFIKTTDVLIADYWRFIAFGEYRRLIVDELTAIWLIRDDGLILFLDNLFL